MVIIEDWKLLKYPNKLKVVLCLTPPMNLNPNPRTRLFSSYRKLKLIFLIPSAGSVFKETLSNKMSSNPSRNFLSKEDAAVSDKFSIFSLDSNFLPAFFAAPENDNRSNLNSSESSKGHFQNFFRKLGLHFALFEL